MSDAPMPTILRTATARALTPLAALVTVLLILAGAAGAQEATPLREPGTLVHAELIERVAADDVQRRARPVFGAYGPVIVENGVAAFRIRYVTTGLDALPTEVTAQVFLPLRVMLDGMPMYVFGSGTTGIGDQCAPSRKDPSGRPVGEYPEYLMAYAGRGFATIIPDYLGFEDPDRVQAYFHAESEAHVMLDAVRAVRQLLSHRGAAPQLNSVPDLSGDVFMGGYSQGGHAAFAAADRMDTYAPDVNIDGIIGYGATTNVGRLLSDGPYYAPYIAVSYQSVYGGEFDPGRIMASAWLPTLITDTVSRCVDEAQQYYPYDASRIFRPEFAHALRAGTVAERFPEVHEVLEANRTGLSGHDVPALVIQGSDDIIARNDTQERFVAELCDAGSSVLYVEIAGARHRHTKPAGFESAVSWMKDLIDGTPAPTMCGGAIELAESPADR